MPQLRLPQSTLASAPASSRRSAICRHEGRARPSVDKLGAVGEPESLTWLKATTEATLPRIDLPDLLFEVHSWTGFLDSFGHVSDRRTRMEGLLVSLVALLVSQSRNIGLTPVIDPNNKALTRSRLSPVDQNYVRADTTAGANAALIGAQSRIELAQMRGAGCAAQVVADRVSIRRFGGVGRRRG